MATASTSIVDPGIVINAMTNILSILHSWTTPHPGFRLGTNTELEAWEKWRILEMEETRRELEAEVWCPLHVAVWRVEDLPLFDGAQRREPPVLGVALAKQTERECSEQVEQYLRSGIDVVWLVLQERHALLVADHRVGKTFDLNEQLSAHPLLPGLRPRVSDFFRGAET